MGRRQRRKRRELLLPIIHQILGLFSQEMTAWDESGISVDMSLPWYIFQSQIVTVSASLFLERFFSPAGEVLSLSKGQIKKRGFAGFNHKKLRVLLPLNL